MPWSGMDQRRFPRAHHQCVVSLRQQVSRPSISATTENVGMGGVCVLLDQGLDIFAPVDLELLLRDDMPPLACRGTVAWVVRRRELNRPVVFDTGIEFVGLSDGDQTRLSRVVTAATQQISRS